MSTVVASVAPSLMPWWIGFRKKWDNCTRCPLASAARQNVVLFRGTIPAPILLIGEAPGESENIKGRPFVGPAGDELDVLMAECNITKFCITNVVACIPWLPDEATIRPPSPKEVSACSFRLQEFVYHCDPRLIIILGKVANTNKLHLRRDTQVCTVAHPAYLVRSRGSRYLSERNRWVLTVKQAMKAVADAEAAE